MLNLVLADTPAGLSHDILNISDSCS